MIHRASILRCLSVIALCAAAGAAHAADKPELIGKFGDWTASRLTEGSQSVCYMSTLIVPSKPKKGKAKRGNVVMMVTHRPSEGATDVISYTAGLKFKPASEAVVTADGKTFNLFTQGDTAWSRDAATDHAIAAVVRGASSLSVAGTAEGGASFDDTVSLKGSSAAYDAITKACGLPEPEKPKAAAKKPAAKKSSKKPAKKSSKRR